MTIPSFTIANLEVRSNLLRFDDYQRKICELSVIEWKDIKGRNPYLISEVQMTPGQREQWRKSLFWATKRVSLKDEDRATGWLHALAGELPKVVAHLEAKPDVEAAFEALYVTESLRSLPTRFQTEAALWKDRIMAVLRRPEFRLTDELIEDRLERLMGREGKRRTGYGR